MREEQLADVQPASHRGEVQGRVPAEVRLVHVMLALDAVDVQQPADDVPVPLKRGQVHGRLAGPAQATRVDAVVTKPDGHCDKQKHDSMPLHDTSNRREQTASEK